MSQPALLQVVSLVINLGLALAVYSFRQTIRVAILEAVAKITETYATKGEMQATEERLKEAIDLRGEVRRVGGGVDALLVRMNIRDGGDRRQPGEAR